MHGFVIKLRCFRRRKWGTFTGYFVLGYLANHHPLVAVKNGFCLLGLIIFCSIGCLALAASSGKFTSFAFATASNARWGTRIVDTFFFCDQST
jgi:hypothetical protein